MKMNTMMRKQLPRLHGHLPPVCADGVSETSCASGAGIRRICAYEKMSQEEFTSVYDTSAD